MISYFYVLYNIMSVIPYEKSFASHAKSQFWSKQNGDIIPRQVYKSSGKKCWFDCNKCSHSFESIIASITRGQWCPYCSNTKLCDDTNCDTCLNKSFASHDKSLFWSSKNGDVTPRQVFKSSGKKYWFICNKCSHSFISILSNIFGGQWCPYCSNPPKYLCDSSICQYCLEKSFASHDKSQYWSKKNGDITPRQVFRTSNTKFWFDCYTCSHSFETILGHIFRGNWCPYCSNPPKYLCDSSTCQYCLEKSFASHDKSQYWSQKNGDITPIQVFRSSGKKFWFDCNICSHSFETMLGHIIGGRWCPYCSNPPIKICNDIDCKTCFDKSFASHDKSQYWSKKNGDITPREVFRSSNKQYWFNCNKCKYSFESVIYSVTGGGSWCPYCVNKTEGKLYEKLKTIYPTIIPQFRQEWCNNKRYDFCIPDLNIIIELDGEQHFKQVSRWKSPEENYANDKYKQECANANHYSMIRLLQCDVWNDKYDWIKELCDAIESIRSCAGETVTNVYLCKKNEYCQYLCDKPQEDTLKSNG